MSATNTLYVQIKALKLPMPEWEYEFHPERKWRFDMAWPNIKLACEIEGVTGGKGGRHQRRQGYTEDCEKYAEAIVLGWTIMRVTPEQIKNGKAVTWLEKMLA